MAEANNGVWTTLGKCPLLFGGTLAAVALVARLKVNDPALNLGLQVAFHVF
jgi:hypothetical protein